MTEEEWKSCDDSLMLLHWMEDQRLHLPFRKARLLNCACTRRTSKFWDDDCHTAVEASEAFADNRISKAELDRAFSDVGYIGTMVEIATAWSARDIDPTTYFRMEVRGAAHIAAGSDGMDPWYRYGGAAKCVARSCPNPSTERCVQAQLIRCIFGNPFRPVPFSPEWRSPTVVALAQGIYDERAFDRMPILGDALEEAGCDHLEVLSHCRGDFPHARGCWVVDGVLGKE